MDTSRPIIALDLPSAGHALGFVSKFTEEKLFVKVGMELFYAAGPQIVTELKDAGHDVFCDLKLHDIPNTVRGAARSLSRLGEGLHDGGSTSNVIAITQLTSTSQQALRDEQLVEAPLIESVCHYADLARQAGLAGVVCSALEARAIADATAEDFLRVTPGIRPAGSAVGDQARVATPGTAASMGSSAIVVGRPITQADDPVAAYHTIRAAWQSGQDA